jgi:hypothetical protein
MMIPDIKSVVVKKFEITALWWLLMTAKKANKIAPQESRINRMVS